MILSAVSSAVAKAYPKKPKPTPAASSSTPTTFDSLYAGDFALTALSNDTVTLISEPAKSTGVTNVSWTDAVYGTKLFRVTNHSTDGLGSVTYARHDYSRHQAFNCDNTRYIIRVSDGFWFLYDANTFSMITKSGSRGSLSGLGGDCEVMWHPTDPNVMYYVGNGGAGSVFYKKTLGSGTTETNTTVTDFAGRLPGGWNLSYIWTKAEGCMSADGDRMAFIVQGASPSYTIQGMFVYQLSTDTILGTMSAATWGGQMMDHISISASGTYVVPSWAFEPTLGTRAYNVTFSSYTNLHTESVHSDLAYGPNNEDYYVFFNTAGGDADEGWIMMTNMATGTKTRLLYVYANNGATAGHISGKCFDVPGWVVISTYADYSNYGGTYPAAIQQSYHNKVMFCKLTSSPTIYNVAHTQLGPYPWPSLYWGEPQWSVNRDGTRLIGASNWRRATDDGTNSYMIGLPSWVVDNQLT